MGDFKRARQPDQIDARRQTLLDAAAELFDSGGPVGAGINGIAARAGFTKSNVYRYFESREHVLLALFLEAFESFARVARGAIEQQAVGNVPGVADALTDAFIASPRLCKLMAVFGSVLERNVSVATIEGVKREMGRATAPVLDALVRRVPGSDPQDCGWVFSMVTALLAGMWPGVIPSAAAAEVLAKPGFEAMQLTLDRDFRRAVGALLSGIVHAADRSMLPTG